MEIELIHDRGFYEAVAAESPLFQGVIDGKATLTEMLDKRVDGELSHSPEDLLEYLGLVSALCDVSYDQELMEKIPYRSEFDEASRCFKDSIAGVFGFGMIVGSLLPATFPVLLFMALDVVVGGGGAVALSKRSTEKRKKAIIEKRAELLKPIYDMAAELDHDIGLNFMLEHFSNVRPRFEQTYRTLDEDGRKEVDTRLHSYLGAGGIPGMDQIQLNDYLSGLLESEPEGDA